MSRADVSIRRAKGCGAAADDRVGRVEDRCSRSPRRRSTARTFGGSNTAIGRSAWPVITLNAPGGCGLSPEQGTLVRMVGAGASTARARSRRSTLSQVYRVARIGRSGTWQPAARAGFAERDDDNRQGNHRRANQEVPSGPGHVALLQGWFSNKRRIGIIDPKSPTAPIVNGPCGRDLGPRTARSRGAVSARPWCGYRRGRLGLSPSVPSVRVASSHDLPIRSPR